MTILSAVLSGCFVLIAATVAAAQNSACGFDPASLRFAGTPVEQARCLLLPNAIGGRLGAPLRRLPKPLEALVGNPNTISRASLRAYLKREKIDESEIGGSLDEPLASATLPAGGKERTLYFVIHDTSYPYLKDDPFPVGFDSDPTWKGNRLDGWQKNPVAHIFVDRLGRSLTATPFSEPVRKGWGTKFARDVLKSDGKALQLHIELIQPRRRDASDSNPDNDRIAPTPGFTDAQYERLALLYVVAGVRRGEWLVPAYHSAVDAGIKDAHDDPQNFDLGRFAAALRRLNARLK